MGSLSSTSAAVAVCGVLGLYILIQRARSYGRKPLPPGPKGLPFIGNVLDMPRLKPWLTWIKWGKKYGDVTYLENLGKPLILLNTYQAATDLLDKRPIYSDRPHSPMLNDLMGWSWNIAFMPYNDEARKHRRILNDVFGPSAVSRHCATQTREAYHLAGRLLDTPENYVEHVKRWAGASVMMITYGHEVAEKNDPYITVAEKGLVGLTQAMVPGAFLVEVLPWLKYIPEWIPGAAFKKKAKVWYQASQDLLHIPYQDTKQKVRDGSAWPSMITDLLENNMDDAGNVKDESAIESCAAVGYVAGFDTTVYTLLSFILAMVVHPQVQKRAQEELDRVVGKDRLPTFEDRPSLPYIDAIFLEVLRWNPVVPMGVAHQVSEDDVYKDYFIPKGTMLMANQWAMLHDETEYPEPLEFKPERFLPQAGKKMPRHPNKVSFGFGRRTCPGRYFADNSIFITAACMLATYDIEKPLDARGKIVEPKVDYSSDFISHPEPFDCRFVPRSSGSAALVRETVERSK